MGLQTSFVLYTAASVKPAAAKAPTSVPAGKRITIRVPAPTEGWVHRVTVYQESGTAADFSVELLASSIPYGSGGVAANYNAVLAAPADPYRVIPAQTETAGNVMDWRAQDSAGGAAGVPYTNMDRVSRTETPGYLYLTVIPTASADASTWCVTVVYGQDVSF